MDSQTPPLPVSPPASSESSPPLPETTPPLAGSPPSSADSPLPLPESPPGYVDVERIVKQERKRLEQLLNSKGMALGSYPRFTVAMKGQKVKEMPMLDFAVVVLLCGNSRKILLDER